MTGKRVVLALGLWLLAAVVIGAATVFAARSSGAAAVTAIVVAEVYTLLIGALTIRLSPAHGTGARAGPLSRRGCRPLLSPHAGVERHRGGDSIGRWTVALVERDHDFDGDGVR